MDCPAERSSALASILEEKFRRAEGERHPPYAYPFPVTVMPRRRFPRRRRPEGSQMSRAESHIRAQAMATCFMPGRVGQERSGMIMQHRESKAVVGRFSLSMHTSMEYMYELVCILATDV